MTQKFTEIRTSLYFITELVQNLELQTYFIALGAITLKNFGLEGTLIPSRAMLKTRR